MTNHELTVAGEGFGALRELISGLDQTTDRMVQEVIQLRVEASGMRKELDFLRQRVVEGNGVPSVLVRLDRTEQALVQINQTLKELGKTPEKDATERLKTWLAFWGPVVLAILAFATSIWGRLDPPKPEAPKAISAPAPAKNGP